MALPGRCDRTYSEGCFCGGARRIRSGRQHVRQYGQVQGGRRRGRERDGRRHRGDAVEPVTVGTLVGCAVGLDVVVERLSETIGPEVVGDVVGSETAGSTVGDAVGLVAVSRFIK